jgi:peptide/nickel transport system permease protein
MLGAAGTLLFVLLVNFFLFRVMPGSPIDTMARNQRLSPDEKTALIRDFGLDRPLLAQLPTYAWDTVRGNLGFSYTSGRAVTAAIGARFWPTVLLVLPSTILAVAIGIALGIYSGWRRGSRGDVGTLGVSLVLYSIPEGWLGLMLLVLFGSILGVFPLGGYSSTDPLTGSAHVADILSHLALPVATLTLAYLGEYVLVMRSSLIDVLGDEYLVTARAKGLPDRLVRRRHAVPNALLPTITIVFYSVGAIFGGAVIVEAVYTWPGLGQLTYQSIENLDYPVIQGVFLLSSAAVIGTNLVADLLYGYVDPRVREA